MVALGGVEGCKVGMLGVDLTELKLLLVEVADAKVFLESGVAVEMGMCKLSIGGALRDCCCSRA